MSSATLRPSDQRRSARSSRRTRRRNTSLRRSRYNRLLCETLEPRLLLSNVTWDGGAGTFNWHDEANWSNDQLPTADDDVIINVPGDITVTLSTGNHSVNSIACAETIRMSGGSLSVADSSSLNNLVLTSGTLSGSGAVTVNGRMVWDGIGTMAGPGTTRILPGGMVEIGRNGDASGVALDGRTLVLASGATTTWFYWPIRMMNGAVLNNYGTFVDSHAPHGGYENIHGDGAFNNYGEFLKTGEGPTSVQVGFNNQGRMDVQAGAISFTSSYIQTAGETQLNGGSIWSGWPLDIQGGTVIGDGILTASVNNGGHMVPGIPGQPAGVLDVRGNYVQFATGALSFEIGGLDAGSQSDQVKVTGTVALNGGVRVCLINDFVAAVGDQFVIIDNDGTDAIIGEFEGLPEGTRFSFGYNEFEISYLGGTGNDVVLTVIDATAIYLPDLTLRSADIAFLPVNPNTGDMVTIAASVVNQGLAKASGALVRFYAFDDVIGEATIANLAPGGSTNVSVQTSFATVGHKLITVAIDPENAIAEVNETNNQASVVLQVGEPPVGDATIVVTAPSASGHLGQLAWVNGRADYDFLAVPGQQDYPVQGGQVTVTVIDPATSAVLGVYTGAHTTVSGTFSQAILTPADLGTYTLLIEVTDKTTSTQMETTMSVVEPPEPVPPMPLPPPSVTRPGRDVFVHSENILFTNDNPQLGEEITIFAYVQYYGEEPVSDLVVTINDIFPVAGTLQTFPIGRTLIDFPASPTASTFVAVSLPWINTADGSHIIQVAAEPTFVQYEGNDNATRLFYVGTPADFLLLSKTVELLVDADGNSIPTPGDTLRYTVSYQNTSENTLTGGVILDDFDESSLQTPFAISGGGTVAQGAITWDIGSIGAGASGSVSYEIQVNPPAEFPGAIQTVVNTAMLDTDQTPPVGASAEIEIIGDNVAPTTTAAITPDPNAAGWHNTDVQVTLSAVDNPGGTGGSRIVYSIDGQQTTVAGNHATFTLTTDGVHAITFHAVDLAMNVEATKSVEIKLDKTPPLAAHNGPFVVNEGDSIQLDGTSSSDALSGIESIAWSLDGDGQFVSGGLATFHGVDGPSTHDVALRVVDLAGNVAILATQVTVLNVAPVAVADEATTWEDVAVTIPVLANDHDAAGPHDPLVLVDVTQPAHGSAVIQDGQILYTPAPGYAGPDTFDYTISDGDGGVATATVTVTVVNLVDISGIVFDDLDNDGIFEPEDGERGIAGVRLEVFDDDGNSQGWTETAADGTYVLDINLATGVYTLVQTQPRGAGFEYDYLDGAVHTGSLGGTIIEYPDRTEITGITITEAMEDVPDCNFAEIRPSQIGGLVWEDFNNDGEVNFGEKAIAGVAVALTGTDDRGNAVGLSTTTDGDGIYTFTALRPGTYTITESQPDGYNDGIDSLGTVNGVSTGVVSANDQFSELHISSPGSLAANYNFGERPLEGGSVSAGQTATIGFWQNRHGQSLIVSLNGGSDQTQLGQWLAATFPNLYASLAGQTNAQVADYYQRLFRQKKAGNSGPAKLEAQVFAVVLATYVTNENLAGTVATAYGFLVTETGVGTCTFNVGDSGEALGVEDGTEVAVLDLLFATNNFSSNGVLYDSLDGEDGDGVIDDLERVLRTLAHDVYAAINSAGN